MTDVFGADYAAAYDLLYADKDYDAECDLIERAFDHASMPVRTVLDLGCGTGAHAIRLAKRGYDVVGADLSEDMLRIARRRATEAGAATLDLMVGDMRSMRIGRQFDAVLAMFAVLGYQTSDEDVTAALATVREHLRPGGCFVFDVWYGPAVEATGPSVRTKTIATADGEIERQAAGVLDHQANVCTVSYRLTRRAAGAGATVSEEQHRMRYFFADDLRRRLDESGLHLDSLVAFPEVDLQPSDASWNVLGVARG